MIGITFERMIDDRYLEKETIPSQVAGQEGLGGEQGKKGWRGEERSS